MHLLIGVDAGGTGTRAVLANEHGRLLGMSVGGAGNWQAIGAAAAGATVRAAVTQALAQAGAQATDVSGSFFALAGVRTDAERAVMQAELEALKLSGALAVGGDMEAAHAGAFADGPGVVLIAGTGSAAWGKNAVGDSWLAGGWGWIVDDKGGGYWLAMRALAAACEAADGRGAATILGARAEAFFAVNGLRELLRELHAGRRERPAVAAFAREVRQAADAGDKVAEALVTEAAGELMRLAEAVRRKLVTGEAEQAFPLAVVGGLGLGERVSELARRAGFAPIDPWGAPVLGSLLRAAELSGASLDAAARNVLLAEWKLRAN